LEVVAPKYESKLIIYHGIAGISELVMKLGEQVVGISERMLRLWLKKPSGQIPIHQMKPLWDF
jgi:hypothetical protein